MIRLLANSWRKNWHEVDAFLHGGMPSFAVSPRPRELWPSVPVFCYHVVDPETLTLDLHFLKRNGYTTLTADQLLQHLTGSQDAPRRSVVISFDDGTEDLYRVGFPILRAQQVQAVAFICPGLHPEHAPDDNCRSRLCSWQEIYEMHASGCLDFQSHTLHHRTMAAWPEEVPIYGAAGLVDHPSLEPLSMLEDLSQARSILETRLSKRVRHLAFPRYEADVAGVRAAEAAGYEGLWWGLRRGRSGNRPGDTPGQIVRLSGEYVRRLPGERRVSLRSILVRRAVRRVTPHARFMPRRPIGAGESAPP